MSETTSSSGEEGPEEADERRDDRTWAISDTAPPPLDPPIEVDVPLIQLARVGLYVVAAVVVVGAIGRAQELLGLVLIAAVLSITLSPLVTKSANLVGTVVSTVVVHLVMLVVIAASTAVAVHSIRVQADALQTYTADQLDALEDAGALTLPNRVRIAERVSDAVAGWGTVAIVGDDTATGMAKRVSELLIVIVLSMFLTLQREQLVDAAMRLTDDRDRRRHVRAVLNASLAAAQAFTIRAAALALGTGLAAAATARVFGLPGVLLIGLWAGLVSLVPLAGPVAAWTPLLVLALLNLSPAATVVVVAAAVVAMSVASFARSRLPLGFEPGGFVVTVGIAAGLSSAGIAGAAAGMSIAVAGAYAFARHKTFFSTDSEAREPCVGSTPRAHRRSSEPTPGTWSRVAPRKAVQAYLSQRTLRVVAGLVVVAAMVQLSLSRVGPALIWAIVGLLLAIGLDRPISWVARRCSLTRTIAVAISALVAAAAIIGLLTTARTGVGAAANIDQDIPQLVETLESLPLVGDRLAEQDLAAEIGRIRRTAPQILNSSPVAERTVNLAAGGLVAVFWILATGLNALVDGPRLVNAINRQVPAPYRRQATRLARAGQHALASYVAGSALVALLNAILVATAAIIVGLPMPAVLALWAFSWNFVPQIGAVIGWAPLLALALAHGPVTGAFCVAFFVVYQLIENNVLQPTIVGHAVDISALAALGAALLGVAVAGLIGAVLAIPIVGVAHAMRTEWQREDFRPPPSTLAYGRDR